MRDGGPKAVLNKTETPVAKSHNCIVTKVSMRFAALNLSALMPLMRSRASTKKLGDVGGRSVLGRRSVVLNQGCFRHASAERRLVGSRTTWGAR